MGAQRFGVGAISWAALAARVPAGATRTAGRASGCPARLFGRAGGGAWGRCCWPGSPAATGWASPRWSRSAVAALGAAAVRMFLAVPGQRIAVVMLVAVLVASRAAPALGLRLARVPRQSFGSITGA